ncbi:MAG TPA: PDGLE domain-containing protein [Candidatus Limnocylindria bacterium]|nr:PDGLE domain-containing protein [Candidatus Limnocylindria bacterium]
MTTTTDRGRFRVPWIIVALGIIAALVVAASIWASADPDGLERVAQDIGFLDVAEDSPFVLIADYVFPGLDGPLATIVAGLIGVAIVFVVVWLLGRVLVRRRSTSGD